MFEKTVAAICGAKIDASIQIDGPTNGGAWFLNAEHLDRSISVEAITEQGNYVYSLIANREIFYGEKGDERFDNESDLIARVLDCIETGSATGKK